MFIFTCFVTVNLIDNLIFVVHGVDTLHHNGEIKFPTDDQLSIIATYGLDKSKLNYCM